MILVESGMFLKKLPCGCSWETCKFEDPFFPAEKSVTLATEAVGLYDATKTMQKAGIFLHFDATMPSCPCSGMKWSLGSMVVPYQYT